MEKIIVEGPAKLEGAIEISGAKNAALPLICATILAKGQNVITNVPRLGDVRTILKLLAIMGCDVNMAWPKVEIDTTDLDNPMAPYELVKTMRAAILVLGPLVARFGKAKVSLPGGCAIGARPINLHLTALQAMGAEIRILNGYVEVESKRLHGAVINFPMVTVGGTENIMMAATLAKGTTVIENAAREPEIEDLAILLNKMGARVHGAGTSTITIEGVDELFPANHSVIPDRIETGTFMVAAAIGGGRVTLNNAEPLHVQNIIDKMRASNIEVTTSGRSITIHAKGDIHPIDVITQPYPLFPTDMQAQFMVLALKAQGTSMITESIFENRYMHVPELLRMGASIDINGHTAIIRGGKPLSAATVMATDLRASASLVLAGLIAEGTTEVLRIYHLDRGYENIVEKLNALGANIRRAKSEMY
ncbi:UDP-N-acetylglucosamine 1-carboxyvinyltransferase [Myxococcota bacterium]|nr:UDP-N-acetylglucosamine 1-carboxyvinyltransferase [Myxococcota bacterium]MBU1380387.1 UDP-N-acetylglucosamine 1-carboxyvinyltransferase [Myxococcota bacterium]MBU1495457.1 UDP-N-acetylglucosamine 1-carboxyvinyltransferase [Myxococcota bacterium]